MRILAQLACRKYFYRIEIQKKKMYRHADMIYVIFCASIRVHNARLLIGRGFFYLFFFLTDAPVVDLELGSNINSSAIQEGMDVYFECNIKSNPWVYRVTWRHNVSMTYTNFRRLIRVNILNASCIVTVCIND